MLTENKLCKYSIRACIHIHIHVHVYTLYIYTVYIHRVVHVNADHFSPAQFKHVSEYEGLTECADKSQLMPELGGYLEYVHEDWVRFRMVSSLNAAVYNVYTRVWQHRELSCGSCVEELSFAV